MLAMFQAMPTHTGTETLQIVLRWVHFVAGITWIGLLYFFNLVNVPFMKQVDAAMKPKVFQYLTLPALFWFRWGAVVTVLAGFWYWAQTIVAVDAHNGNGSVGAPIGWFFLIWTVLFAIEMGILMAPGLTKNGWVYAVIVAILAGAAAYIFVLCNSGDWQSNRLISIGIGGGFGWVMLLNVWGIIWRNNKKIINGTLAGTPPANGAVLGRQAFLASRTNAWLSLPMLFFMAAASHYGLFGR
jgi:uncharacterized membrane protein